MQQYVLRYSVFHSPKTKGDAMQKHLPQEHGIAHQRQVDTSEIHQCAAPEVDGRSFEQDRLTSEKLSWDTSAQDATINTHRRPSCAQSVLSMPVGAAYGCMWRRITASLNQD
jgi:hypothetical protein